MEFGNDLRHNLTRPTVGEAVLRIRTTKGLTPFQYFGNFFLRGVDLLGIPTIDSDKTITLEMSVDEDLSKNSSWVKGGEIDCTVSTNFVRRCCDSSCSSVYKC